MSTLQNYETTYKPPLATPDQGSPTAASCQNAGMSRPETGAGGWHMMEGWKSVWIPDMQQAYPDQGVQHMDSGCN